MENHNYFRNSNRNAYLKELKQTIHEKEAKRQQFQEAGMLSDYQLQNQSLNVMSEIHKNLNLKKHELNSQNPVKDTTYFQPRGLLERYFGIASNRQKIIHRVESTDRIETHPVHFKMDCEFVEVNNNENRQTFSPTKSKKLQIIDIDMSKSKKKVHRPIRETHVQATNIDIKTQVTLIV